VSCGVLVAHGHGSNGGAQLSKPLVNFELAIKSDTIGAKLAGILSFRRAAHHLKTGAHIRSRFILCGRGNNVGATTLEIYECM
jgi:hypothetical protein